MPGGSAGVLRNKPGAYANTRKEIAKPHTAMAARDSNFAMMISVG